MDAILITASMALMALGIILCAIHYAKYGIVAHPYEMYGLKDHGLIGLILILIGALALLIAVALAPISS